MNLVIYSLCRESDLLRKAPKDPNFNEEPIKVEWSEDVPGVGQSVSLGGEQRWFKVQITRYQSAQQDIDVYFVHVNRTLAVPVGWDCDGRENETIHVELSTVGESILGFAFNVLGEAPKVGSRLMNYQRTSHPTLMQETSSDWIRDRYDECIPQGAAPYKAIYLTWCKQNVLTTAQLQA
ncbi:MAG: hypothetical protein KME13_24080 [Myxacorys californica WJT36-NPBG1]|jgi:hypothetical protein|nr:hypothetical protein [Myxacorys californica WJT36-NPBG1]